jgi:hypothetical protein
VLKTQFLAEGANDNQWYELSMRRSAIQSLIDDYRDTPIEALINLDDVAQLDDELRALGQHDEQGPVRARTKRGHRPTPAADRCNHLCS